jgi:two-component system nitrogen regulation sensor histidine kinase GlnL
MAHVVVGRLDDPHLVLIEWLPLDQQLRSERDARLVQQVEANKSLMRNLAHEIKNPLGGIRGAAQLLEFELPDRSLHEYTQVIIKESDRLQSLVDRLLAPHKKQHIDDFVNIHEVLERVRSLVLAEFPQGLTIQRNYDISLPDLLGDKEALIQAVLNVVHNAAQALREQIAHGTAVIELQTRVARNVTISKQRYKLALDLHIKDNGPGIPEEIKDKIFFPLVSGKEGGSGLGLTLAQTYIQQHFGFIGCTSAPGSTNFQMQMPFRIKNGDA